VSPSRDRSPLLAFLTGATVALLLTTFLGSANSDASSRRYDDLALFTSVLDLVRQNYVEPVDEHDLLMSAMQGLLKELDPHSVFMNVEAYGEMQEDTKGEFQGLGIEITKQQGGYIEVVSPIEGTPADRAGLEARDQITAICPTDKPPEWTEPCGPTDEMPLFKAVQLMRGKKGTEITIYILREGFDAPQPFTIRRDVVKTASVKGELLEPGYGYVRISSFQERTDHDLKKQIEDIVAESGDTPLSGFVLDLRDNPGGLLNQAVAVADVWIDDGLIVYTQGRDDSARQDFDASAEGAGTDYPIVVLVNGGSASASEIVAGALQDHHRALVLGQPTFGKGSVQTVYPLEGGSGLRLTTALYYTPSGRSIQEVGISPDIIVSPNDRSDGLVMRPRIRERDLRGHFTQEEASPDAPTPMPLELEDTQGGAEPAPGEAAEQPMRDVQLDRALEVLKSWTYFERLREMRDAEKPKAPTTTAALEQGAAATP